MVYCIKWEYIMNEVSKNNRKKISNWKIHDQIKKVLCLWNIYHNCFDLSLNISKLMIRHTETVT